MCKIEAPKKKTHVAKRLLNFITTIFYLEF